MPSLPPLITQLEIKVSCEYIRLQEPKGVWET